VRFPNAFSAIGRFLLLGGVAAGVAAGFSSGATQIAFVPIALALGIIGLVFALIGGKLGNLAGLDKVLRGTGVAGTATVVSMRETGVRINQAPVVELELDVDVSVHAPYRTTIKQRLPLFWGPVKPGIQVGVLVDPVDREHLAVDWDSETPQRRATRAEPEADTPRAQHDVEHLLRTGRRAKAVVISMEDAGEMTELGLVEMGSPRDDDRLFIIDMEVTQAGGMDPYEVRVAHGVPERLVGRVGPRTRLVVAVDRLDDHAVAIDWDSVQR
jgi:hypothetical protein